MGNDTRRNGRFVALFLLGFFLFNDPILSLFDVPLAVNGIPLLYGYLFAAWLLLIVLVRLAATSGSRRG